MESGVPQAVPPVRSASSQQRRIGAAIAGAAVGLALGLGIGYFGRSPLFGSETVFGYVLILVPVGLAIVIGLIVLGIVRRSYTALVACGALIAAAAVGVFVAPVPTGGQVQVGGTVTVGTPSNPTALRSGSIQCQWSQGDSYVSLVTGLNTPVSDPAILEALDLPAAGTIDRIFIGNRAPFAGGTVSLEFGAGAQPRMGSFTPVTVQQVSAGARSGTLIAGSTVVISWSCSSAPNG